DLPNPETEPTSSTSNLNWQASSLPLFFLSAPSHPHKEQITLPPLYLEKESFIYQAPRTSVISGVRTPSLSQTSSAPPQASPSLTLQVDSLPAEPQGKPKNTGVAPGSFLADPATEMGEP
ncbi:unnamed protein product, partial [Rangifer tarandus platyrhynchus]